MLTKRDYILSHKTHLNKFKRIEIIQTMLSYHSEMKLKINDIEIAEKSPNIWRLNSTCLNNIWVKKQVSREIKKHF